MKDFQTARKAETWFHHNKRSFPSDTHHSVKRQIIGKQVTERKQPDADPKTRERNHEKCATIAHSGTVDHNGDKLKGYLAQQH